MTTSSTTRDSQRQRVAITRTLPAASMDRFRACHDVWVNPDDRVLTPDELMTVAGNADVLVVTAFDRFDARVIAALPASLQVLATHSVGLEHIDLDAAKARGLPVLATPDVLSDSVAEMAILLMLGAARRVHEGNHLLYSGQWKGWTPTQLVGIEVTGKRMGIVGMGRIGRALALRARGFGLAIHYHNRKRVHGEIERELEATYWESLDQMLARMDIVSVNCPHTPATFHLLSARRLKLMKPTAIIINTARGEIIDENAMVRMLKAGELAGVGLDVYEHEPQVNPKLLELDNVVLLPHMGSATLEGRIEMGEKVLINIKTFADGHKPPDRVLAAMI